MNNSQFRKKESIDNSFAKFNIIITSLKALDECYSSKNYVRKFLRALHPKWRAKVTDIEQSKDLTSLSLEEVIGTTYLGLRYHKGTGIETLVYADSDDAGDYVDRKSTSDAARRRQSVENVQTYTRRSRLVSTVDVSTDSELGSTTGVKAENKGKAIMQECEAPKNIKRSSSSNECLMRNSSERGLKINKQFNAEHQQEKSDFEIALELQK
ncbi:hypothetical protein Tco_0851372, partial [Tanacetum coccineum]